MKQGLSGIDTIVLDIEGTICPISFVKETLFPYAISALPGVLKEKWNDPEFVPYRDAFPEEFRSSPEALEAHVQDLTKRDVKIAYLKNLQGYLWHTGYTTGAYSTPLFPDVLPALKSWSPTKTIAIYSSGSIQAQRLLFNFVQSPSGTVDERALITSWFDTTNAGSKTSKSSYTIIAESLGREEGRILFLSDSVPEVEAALEAGMQACVVVRQGNKALSKAEKERFDVVYELGQVKLQ